MIEPVTIAILAKAPIAGQAKTRLIPALGPDGAATLQTQLIAHTAATASTAAIGPVTLWATPDVTHPAFADIAARTPLTLVAQPDGDLGTRMLAAIEAANAPILVIGTDCPALTVDHLHDAAAALREGSGVVVIPAEDGGYVLIGMCKPQPGLFTGIQWGVDTVMADTRQRLIKSGLTWHEFEPLWDVDYPKDLERLYRFGPNFAPIHKVTQ